MAQARGQELRISRRSRSLARPLGVSRGEPGTRPPLGQHFPSGCSLRPTASRPSRGRDRTSGIAPTKVPARSGSGGRSTPHAGTDSVSTPPSRARHVQKCAGRPMPHDEQWGPSAAAGGGPSALSGPRRPRHRSTMPHNRSAGSGGTAGDPGRRTIPRGPWRGPGGELAPERWNDPELAVCRLVRLRLAFEALFSSKNTELVPARREETAVRARTLVNRSGGGARRRFRHARHHGIWPPSPRREGIYCIFTRSSRE
jgi:hypothetical protein